MDKEGLTAVKQRANAKAFAPLTNRYLPHFLQPLFFSAVFCLPAALGIVSHLLTPMLSLSPK